MHETAANINDVCKCLTWHAHRFRYHAPSASVQLMCMPAIDLLTCSAGCTRETVMSGRMHKRNGDEMHSNGRIINIINTERWGHMRGHMNPQAHHQDFLHLDNLRWESLSMTQPPGQTRVSMQYYVSERLAKLTCTTVNRVNNEASHKVGWRQKNECKKLQPRGEPQICQQTPAVSRVCLHV